MDDLKWRVPSLPNILGEHLLGSSSMTASKVLMGNSLSLYRKRDEYWESALSLVLQRNTAIFIDTILASLTHCFDYLNRNSIHYLIKIFTLKEIQLLFGEKKWWKCFPLDKLERSSRRQSSECRHRQRRLSPWIVPTLAWIHLPQAAMAFCLSGAQNLWTSRFKSSLPMAEICFY